MNNVNTISNVLSPQLLEIIKDFSRTGEITHSYMLWEQGIIKDSNPVLIKKINEQITSKLIHEIKDHLPEYNSIGCLWYGWQRGSYIPWHLDSHAIFGATIYLNEYWDDDWGGYFAYKDNEEIRCIKPEYNKMTIIKPPIEHTVFGLTNVAPIRETIQIFGR